MKYKLTKEELEAAVKDSYSIAQVLRKLNLVAAGGNFSTIKKKIKQQGIDFSHFTGKGYMKGKTFSWKKMPSFK